MHENYEFDSEYSVHIDDLDRKILEFLKKDARMAYTDIAKKLIVSSGTIHQRINKMIEAGVVTGSSFQINYQLLGFDVTTLLGIHLKSAKDQNKVIDKLSKINEVTEVYYTTGSFGLMIKVQCKSIKHFHVILSEKIQSINEIQSTESFICLDQPIHRQIKL